MLAAMKPAVLALAALGVALTAAPAAANMAAPPPPSRLGGLEPAGPTPLEVRAAALVIDCSSGPDACRLRVTYQLHNAGSAATTGVAAFYALDTEDLAVTVDGKPADRELDPTDLEAFDAADAAAAAETRTVGGAVTLATELSDPRRVVEGLSLHGVQLDLAAGATAEVVVTGTILPRERRRYFLSLPAAPARHRLLVLGGRGDRRLRLHYLVAPIRTWSAFPAEMSLTLTHPSSWDASLAGALGVTARTAGGVTTHTGRIATDEPTLEVELAATPRTPIHGGLVLGVGGHLDDATGTRVRLGVEAGRGAYLASVAVELERTDDATGVVVVPALAAASPWVLVLPSIGLGLGAPIRLRPDVEVGVRFQADAHFGPVGLVTAFDYFPGMDAGPRRFSVAMMAQLSL